MKYNEVIFLKSYLDSNSELNNCNYRRDSSRWVGSWEESCWGLWPGGTWARCTWSWGEGSSSSLGKVFSSFASSRPRERRCGSPKSKRQYPSWRKLSFLFRVLFNETKTWKTTRLGSFQFWLQVQEKLRKWNVYLGSKGCGESSLESNCYNVTIYKKASKPQINLQFICLSNKIIAYINIYFYFHFSN